MKIEITQEEADALRDTSSIVIAIDQDTGEVADYAVGQAVSSEDIEPTEGVEIYMPACVDTDEHDGHIFAVPYGCLWWDKQGRVHATGGTAPVSAVAEYAFDQGRLTMGSIELTMPASAQGFASEWEDMSLGDFRDLVLATLAYMNDPSSEARKKVDETVRRIEKNR